MAGSKFLAKHRIPGEFSRAILAGAKLIAETGFSQQAPQKTSRISTRILAHLSGHREFDAFQMAVIFDLDAAAFEEVGERGEGFFAVAGAGSDDENEFAQRVMTVVDFAVIVFHRNTFNTAFFMPFVV